MLYGSSVFLFVIIRPHGGQLKNLIAFHEPCHTCQQPVPVDNITNKRYAGSRRIESTFAGDFFCNHKGRPLLSTKRPNPTRLKWFTSIKSAGQLRLLRNLRVWTNTSKHCWIRLDPRYVSSLVPLFVRNNTTTSSSQCDQVHRLLMGAKPKATVAKRLYG